MCFAGGAQFLKPGILLYKELVCKLSASILACLFFFFLVKAMIYPNYE